MIRGSEPPVAPLTSREERGLEMALNQEWPVIQSPRLWREASVKPRVQGSEGFGLGIGESVHLERARSSVPRAWPSHLAHPAVSLHSERVVQRTVCFPGFSENALSQGGDRGASNRWPAAQSVGASLTCTCGLKCVHMSVRGGAAV